MILQKYNGQLCRLLAVLLSFAVSRVISVSHDHLIHRYNASSGDTVTIPCHHTGPFSSPSNWVRPRSGQVLEKEICLGSICQNGFAVRFSVDAIKNYQLTIQNVTTNDTGNYVCIAFDDYTSHRYTNELIVADRPLKPLKDGQGTTTATAVDDYSTNAKTQTELSDVTVVVIIAAAIVSPCLVIIVVIIIVVVRRRRANARADGFSDIELYYAKNPQIADFEDNNRLRQRKHQPETATTVEDAALISDARVLALTFLKLFRQFYEQGKKSTSAAKSFKILAASSAQWRKAMLESGAAQRRIRSLILYECSGYTVCPVRLDSVGSRSATTPVKAAAVMDGRVYTICNECDTIFVVSGQEESIRVKGMKFPVDIVACASGEVLYIADEQRCIWRVQVGGETKNWKQFSELVPRTLSINWHGSLLVTTDSNVILKFTRAGSGGKVINLEEHTEVLHAVETSRHTAVVCYTLGTRAGVVAEIGFDGQIIHKFICVPQLIRTPSYLALDCDGRIIVADPGNSRILLLDSKLKHSYTIIDHRRHGIGTPQRLCLDETTGTLLVADWPSHSVQPFNIKTPTTRSTTKLQKSFRKNV